MIPKIFISYNPGVETEQSTALRLQTLSSLYNAKVNLPDRSGKAGLKENTKQRILESAIFVMFSTDVISSEVLDEVNFALANNKTVIIFYDETKGKKINTSKVKNKQNLNEKAFNPVNSTPNELLDYIKEVLQKNKGKKNSGVNKVLLAVLGIGLGLLLLDALTDDDDDYED